MHRRYAHRLQLALHARPLACAHDGAHGHGRVHDLTNVDFRLAVLVACVQVWLEVTSSLRLSGPGKAPGNVARCSMAREAARGVSQVAISGLRGARAQMATFALLCSSQLDRAA